MSTIPVFVSCPSKLNSEQEKINDWFDKTLKSLHLERRAIGRTDPAVKNPLTEVLALASHCAGGMILGFKQTKVIDSIVKEGTNEEDHKTEPYYLPTPWNNLEAGILFSLKLPILLVKEKGVCGGVFDAGSTEYFVIDLPEGSFDAAKMQSVQDSILNWSAQVRARYYTF